MDSFVRKTTSKPAKPKVMANSAAKTDFLSAATAAMADKNKDVGLDILGDLKDNLDNVKEFFGLVKELGNIKGEIQQLQFTERFPLKEYRLLEVDKKLLSEFEQGQQLVFRGGTDDYVVLCSENRTFDVKEVETSNSLLFFPNLSVGDEVEDCSEHKLVVKTGTSLLHHYFELKEIECVSNFKLRGLLQECELPWNWEQTQVTGQLYTYEALLDLVQMSEGQLKMFLDHFPVIEHEGFMRWMSYDFCDSMVDAIVEMCDDDAIPEISIESVNYGVLRSRLPLLATNNAINWFLREFCELTSPDGTYRILARPVVRNRGGALLRTVNRLERTIFEKQLDQMLPLGIQLDYSYLDGMALTEDTVKGSMISYLNVDDLPEDPRERLKVLFAHKPTWTMEEVAPYLSDICSNQKNMNGLMVSHCRSEKDSNGEKVFCALRAV